VRNIFSPAKIEKVEEDAKQNVIYVYVPDEYKPIAF
jgi:transcription antitermination factor NusA-like protein